MKDYINVSLISETNVSPEILASHAAKMCYEPDVPELGKLIDVKGRLFDTGHHTTLQHNYFTFAIDGISVSGVCFGLHLTAPYYNTDQRSGRFSKMYDDPDIDSIRHRLQRYFQSDNFWVPYHDIEKAEKFIQKGLDIYANNKEKVTQIVAKKIKAERPFASEKYINSNVHKFAQEQLRMFISMVAPTALDYTINLSTLVAFQRTAWTTEMRDVISKMVKIVTNKYPDISYMFEDKVKSGCPHFEALDEDWSPELVGNKPNIVTKPNLTITDLKYDESKLFENENAKDMVDTLYFTPKGMNNTQNYVSTNVELSCATMGQDQRHRSIKHGEPVFTGNFYLPPLLKLAGLEKEAVEFMDEFISLRTDANLNKDLWTMIAPYGAMVKYDKTGDLNALMHEQGKRTCWCAQEEIYNLGTQLREQLAQRIGTESKLIKKLSPHCYADGKCCESSRYCGRDIKERLTKNYFKDRQI